MKMGHLEQAAQDLVQVGLEYLQRRRYSRDIQGDYFWNVLVYNCPLWNLK